MAIATARPKRQRSSVTDPDLLIPAIGQSFVKLDPRTMARNPVMFIVEIGAVMTTYGFIAGLVGGGTDNSFVGQIALWLWFTVLFANFAEAIAEGRGKAQAQALRRTRTETIARKLDGGIGGKETPVPAIDLRKGDIVVCEAGDVIPSDGTIVEGIASVDESAITGESAPVIREAGGDRSAVTGGTRVLSDRIVIEITQNPGETFLDRMISLVESASRQKTPNEIALNILLASLTLIFLIAVVTLQPYAIFSGASIEVPVLIALLVCLIPTTIGGLLSAIGIAGIDRLLQKNVLAMSGRAVEAAGDVDTLLLDKTGTITLGNRQATEFLPAPGISMEKLVRAADLASRADETPEGRSIVALARRFGAPEETEGGEWTFVPFTAETRMSGVDRGTDSIRKGAGELRRRVVRRRCRLEGCQRAGGDDRPERRNTVARRGESRRPRHHPPQGHRQARYLRALRGTAPDGTAHGDDHRGQPAHGRRNREGSRRRRLPRPGDTGEQARPDPSGAGGRQARRDDRRRHQRRAGTRSGGCRRRDEQRDPGCQRRRPTWSTSTAILPSSSRSWKPASRCSSRVAR